MVFPASIHQLYNTTTVEVYSGRLVIGIGSPSGAQAAFKAPQLKTIAKNLELPVGKLYILSTYHF
jgi:hypothetical protein